MQLQSYCANVQCALTLACFCLWRAMGTTSGWWRWWSWCCSGRRMMGEQCSWWWWWCWENSGGKAHCIPECWWENSGGSSGERAGEGCWPPGSLRLRITAPASPEPCPAALLPAPTTTTSTFALLSCIYNSSFFASVSKCYKNYPFVSVHCFASCCLHHQQN